MSMGGGDEPHHLEDCVIEITIGLLGKHKSKFYCLRWWTVENFDSIFEINRR